MAETSRTAVAAGASFERRSAGTGSAAAVLIRCAMNSGARVQASASTAAMMTGLAISPPSMTGAMAAT